MEWLSKLRALDVYSKPIEDFRVRTFAGAIISIISIIIIAWLFIAELLVFLSTDVQSQLYVDTSRGEKLRINVDITFPSMPCAYISVDAMDVSGDHQLDVSHNIYMKRLSTDGTPIAVTKEEKLGGKDIAPLPEAEPGKCGSCYGAEEYKGQCCNNCEQVREAYRKKGWAFSTADAIEQCIREGFTESLIAQQGEGCQIYGFLLVNKVAGNFHVAPGKSFQQHHMHVHDLQPFRFASFNMSHVVNQLSFGKQFPGIINPLDGVRKAADQDSVMFQYYVKIVPTVYESLNGNAIHTNQFSVTEHWKALDKDDQSGHGLPGVFFMYELSPIMVKFTETTPGLASFLTSVCAIIGGVFTVAGLIDTFVYHSLKSLEKKMQLGKAL